jgi:hypothetical protein
MSTDHISIKWDRTGVVSLTTSKSGKRYTAGGAGYDKTGTLLGDYLTTEHQDALLAIAGRAQYTIRNSERTFNAEMESWMNPGGAFYGMTYDADQRRVSLDGCVGVQSMERMERIAEAAGVALTRHWNHRGETTGYTVDSAAAERKAFSKRVRVFKQGATGPGLTAEIDGAQAFHTDESGYGLWAYDSGHFHQIIERSQKLGTARTERITAAALRRYILEKVMPFRD